MLLNCDLEKTLEPPSLDPPSIARRANQSILMEISPEYSFQLKLKLQYFEPLMHRTDLLEKMLMLGKIEVRRRRR